MSRTRQQGEHHPDTVRDCLEFRGNHRAAFWRGFRATNACPYEGWTGQSRGYRRAWGAGRAAAQAELRRAAT